MTHLASAVTEKVMAACWPRAVLLFASILSTGCIETALLNGQIAATRQGAAAFDTIDDWELAYSAASSGIVQLEGMHVLAPHNKDALFMLSKAYAGFAYAFAEDDLEVSEDLGDANLAEYHRKRAIRSYSKSIEYGVALWEERGFQGFDAARQSQSKLAAWLNKFFTQPDDAADLFWTGYAWLARTNLQREDAEAVANLFVAVTILEKAVQLQPSYNHDSGVVALAAYHARSATAELGEAKKMFDNAIRATDRKSLIVLYNYATGLACAQSDSVTYRKLLREVIATEGSEPTLRLTNVIAQRKARRWLAPRRMFNACSIEAETGGNDGPS